MQKLLNICLRQLFYLLYHQLAWTYDSVAWLVSFGDWKTWAQTTLPHLAGRRVLELAHGPGHLLAAMHQHGLQPIGLDLSPEMGRLAHGRLRRAGVTVPLVRARAQALPFRDGAFESAVATFPTEFIVDPDTLREAARVLGPAGRLVVVPGVAFSRPGLAARLFGWLYAVTGQRDLPAAGTWQAVTAAGFAVSHIRQRVGSVEVVIVVARKRHSV